MRLLLFRHGPPEDPDPTRWPDDLDRPLSDAGARETARACAGLSLLMPEAGRIATSVALRASATAEALRASLHHAPELEVWAELSPGAEATALLVRIALSNSPSGPLVLVGHAPTLPQLAALALPDSGDLPFPLGRAAAALIDFPGPVAPGRALPLWAYSREELIDYGEAHGAARKGAAPTSRS
ncbi:MAG: histidine phosphatase family protein [Thermoplasmata archaeon]|nr:histidine phosphatase family protein [Thermoplasmata archaeon]